MNLYNWEGRSEYKFVEETWNTVYLKVCLCFFKKVTYIFLGYLVLFLHNFDLSNSLRSAEISTPSIFQCIQDVFAIRPRDLKKHLKARNLLKFFQKIDFYAVDLKKVMNIR